MLAGSQFVGSIGVPRASPDPHRWRRPGMAKWSREQKTDVFVSFVGGLSIGTVTWHGFVSKANHDKCCMFLRLQRCRYQQLESRAGGLRKSARIGFGDPVLGLNVVCNVRDQAADRKPQKVPQDMGNSPQCRLNYLSPHNPNGKWLLEGPILDNFHGHWERRKAIMNCPDSCSNNPWRAL